MSEPSVVSIHSRRRSSIATPENIFPACTALYEERGHGFNADDVIARIGGGSKTTVGPIIKLWRHYQPLFEATQSLDETSAVQIAQTIDGLLSAKTKQMDSAMKAFHESSGLLIAELTEDKEELEESLEASQLETADLQQQLKRMEEKVAQLKTELDAKDRQLNETSSQLTLKTDELTHTQKSHTAKIEQIASEHATELTMALESQRKAIVSEFAKTQQDLINNHKSELTKLNQHHDGKMAEQSKRYSTLETLATERLDEILDLKKQLNECELQRREKEKEYATAEKHLQDRISDKQAALDAANNTAQSILQNIIEKLSSSNDGVMDKLDQISSAANDMNTAMESINELLQKIKSPNEKESKEGKNE